MTDTLRVTLISGSLRQASYSQMILNSIATLLPADSRISSLDIGAYPHYDQDLEDAGLPDVVRAGRQQIADSDAVIVVTPEFNHGIPGVLKNTLDWLSRPAFKSTFAAKPVFFVTHAPGPLGGVRAQYQLRETFASMLCLLPPVKEVAISAVADKLTDGQLTDSRTLESLQRSLQDFLRGARLQHRYE